MEPLKLNTLSTTELDSLTIEQLAVLPIEGDMSWLSFLGHHQPVVLPEWSEPRAAIGY